MGLRGKIESEQSSNGSSRELSDSSVPVSPIGESPGETVRPWTCSRAHFVVKPPRKGTVSRGNRVIRLREDKSTLEKNLPKTPYIKLKWGSEGCTDERNRTPMTALIDTGADWSLVTRAELSEEEVKELQPTEEAGESVTKERIPVIGEIWRDLFLEEVVIPQQRFIVVEDMITPVILGADFWMRLGEFTLDFVHRKLRVTSLGVEVNLMEEMSNREPGNSKQAVMVCKEEVHIPPFTEMLITVEGGLDTFSEGEEVFIEPISKDTGLHSVPFTIACVREGCVVVRMANLGCSDLILEKGTTVATASEGVALGRVAHVRRLGAGRRDSGKSTNKLDFLKYCGGQLSNDQREEMVKLLSEFEDVFYQGGPLSTVTVGVEHQIRTRKDVAPIAHRPRRLSAEEEKEVRKEIEDLTEMGVIRQSNSPWAAPIVCARKSNGKLRLAIDYRGLNAVSLPATLHPIPRIDDLFDRLGEARFFSVLDAKSGYHQLPIPKEESEITAFVVPWGQFEFIERTPFGLKGAGYSFQRMMSTILGECNFRDALCYLDDILVWSRTWEEHVRKLRGILRKLHTANLKLGLAKCRFGVDEVDYLGSTIKNGMLSISEQRVETLKTLPRPGTVTELRRALGAFAFIQRWLPGLAEVNGPLYSAVGGVGRRQLKWTDEMIEAFEKLKSMTAEAVALRIPDLSKPFVLVTDGSDKGLGASWHKRKATSWPQSRSIITRCRRRK